MITTRSSALGLLCVMLAGCASESSRQPETWHRPPPPSPTALDEAARQLAAARSCCDALAALPFEPLPIDFNGDVRIDASAPAFQFTSGKSFFRAFRLPDGNRAFDIRLFSQAGESVLAPHVLLLDQRYQVTRSLEATDFRYEPASGMKEDSLDARLHIDRSYPDHPGNETYLVLFTTPEQLSGHTRLRHPAKAYAKAVGVQEPDIADPIARHSAVGLIKMSLRADTQAGTGTNRYLPAPMAYAPSANAAEILPETAAYYRERMDLALAEQDLQRALRLAEEAERAGDSKAKAYLLERLRVK